jgi:DNA (cytosine-5)-methyltransferase 1
MGTYFSTFTGIGGLESGLEEMGWECAGFSEIRESSIQIYRNHYPTVKNYGDITAVEISKLPDFDMFIGGFPCQSFSLAGMRKGFNDPRGLMIMYIRNILLEKKPMFAVLENVKGILNHDHGRTYIKVIKLLQSAGYFVRVLMLNSIHYGSAQSRERVLFLCSKKDFERKVPMVKNDRAVFRNIEDTRGPFKEISRSRRNVEKINQEGNFPYELIGSYDRVGTLTTQQGCGLKAVVSGDWFRQLTPLECERLQGFPDGWTQGVKDADRYFALGNAVNCNVSKYLFTEYLKGIWY